MNAFIRLKTKSPVKREGKRHKKNLAEAASLNVALKMYVILDNGVLLFQPLNGWTSTAVDKFSSLVLHRRLKAEIVHPFPGKYGSNLYTVDLFTR